MYRNFSLDGRGKFFPPRGIRMELRDQRERGIEERKNFSLVTTLPYLFWDSPRARHATRYRFSKGRRKSTLFDHRSGRWPGFDDTKVYETTFQWRCFGFFLLSSFDRVIAKFENRWILVSRSHRFPTERSSPARSKAQSWGGIFFENNDTWSCYLSFVRPLCSLAFRRKIGWKIFWPKVLLEFWRT